MITHEVTITHLCMSIFLTGFTGCSGYFFAFHATGLEVGRRNERQKVQSPFGGGEKELGARNMQTRRRSNELWRVSPKVMRETKR